MKLRVLILDDEATCRAIGRLLMARFDLAFVHRGDAALRLFAEGEAFGAVLCDLRLPDISGLIVFARAEAAYPEQAAGFIFHTGSPDLIPPDSKVPVLAKPCESAELFRVIDAVAARRLGATNRELAP